MTTADEDPTTEAGTEATSAPTETDAGGAGTTLEREAETTRDEHLISHDAVVDFRSRWEVIQQGFVDDPRSAVSDADGLVGDVLDKLSATFDEQRQQLEGQWSDGEADTEDLRTALQRYRDFFDRLLTI